VNRKQVTRVGESLSDTVYLKSGIVQGSCLWPLLFLLYVRPILEYASNIWSPTQIGLIDKLESVQRRFTERIPGFETLSYSERSSLLDLENLELRRLRADLITTYKVIFGLLEVSSNFFVFRDNSVTSKVMLGHCDNNSQKQFLPHRIAKVWNSLPAADTEFTNLISFRASIQNINLHTFTRF